MSGASTMRWRTLLGVLRPALAGLNFPIVFVLVGILEGVPPLFVAAVVWLVVLAARCARIGLSVQNGVWTSRSFWRTRHFRSSEIRALHIVSHPRRVPLLAVLTVELADGSAVKVRSVIADLQPYWNIPPPLKRAIRSRVGIDPFVAVVGEVALEMGVDPPQHQPTRRKEWLAFPFVRDRSVD